MRILYNSDTWDAATITSSSEAGDLVDDYVVNDFLGRPWRTTGDSAEWIKFDLGAATEITCIGLFGLNVTSAATVTLQAHTSDSWASPDLDQTLTVATDSDSTALAQIVYFPTANNTKRWWRVTFADAANPDGYIEVGRIKAGAYYEPARGYSDGSSIEWVDPSEGSTVAGTLTAYRERTLYREASLQFRYMTRTQRDKWDAIFRKVGRRKPVVLSLRPATYPTHDSLYCTLSTPMSIVREMVDVHHSGALVWREVTE